MLRENYTTKPSAHLLMDGLGGFGYMKLASKMEWAVFSAMLTYMIFHVHHQQLLTYHNM